MLRFIGVNLSKKWRYLKKNISKAGGGVTTGSSSRAIKCKCIP